jgi:hypothetical protein
MQEITNRKLNIYQFVPPTTAFIIRVKQGSAYRSLSLDLPRSLIIQQSSPIESMLKQVLVQVPV